MLLTITTTHSPASDLGYLLAKNPSRVQSFELAFGKAHVYYPEVSEERCTAALLLDLDPLDLVRSARRNAKHDGLLTQYVNDRPYVASSLMSVAMGRVFGSALGGRCRERPELANTPIPLEAFIAALPVRGGEKMLRGLFEPLGYAVETTRVPLDPHFPDWGESAIHQVTLRAEVRLSELLGHLYVLIPVLDDEKHYWVGDEEVDKLLAKAGAWMKEHPLRETIAARYLKRQRHLTRTALARLEPEAETAEETAEETDAPEKRLEAKGSLNEARIAAVVAALEARGATRVVDLGCGEGKLLRALLKVRAFERVAGMEVSPRALEHAARRLRLEDMPARRRERISLFQGSLTYRDARLEGYDAACLVEVIEHVDPSRLPALERVVFEFARPATVVVTTPNAEHNVRFEGLHEGAFRHADHRFEWTREEFARWADAVAQRSGYTVGYESIGADDPEVGPPTQMAIFEVAS